MSKESPLYNPTPKEETQNNDPSTTNKPEHPSMNAAPDNYMSHYNSTLMNSYPDGSPPTTYRQGPVQHPNAQWESHYSQAPTYRPINSTVYYTAGTPMMPQQDAAHVQLPPQYPRWPTESPVQLNTQVQHPPSPGSEYYPRHHSPTTYRQPGEAGPSRNNPRSSRRGLSQDFALNVPQMDGSSTEISQYSPTATSPTRRSQGSSAQKPVSGDAKSFSCTLCSATFTRKGDCLRHRRSVHTRETPYDCQGCGERFSRSDMRGKHWKADPNCENIHWREVCKAMGKEGLVEDT